MNAERQFVHTSFDETIIREIQLLSNSLQFAGTDLSSKAELLAQSLSAGEVACWLYADLYKEFDLDGFECRIRDRFVALRYVALVARVLSALAGFLLILYTGINAWGALTSYAALPAGSGIPTFLLAWEQGFNQFLGTQLSFTYRLSQVVVFDFLLVLLIVTLAVIEYIGKYMRELYVMAKAKQLRAKVRPVLDAIGRFLSYRRHNIIADAVMRFQTNAHALLAYLEGEQNRAHELVQEREREAKELTVFSNNFVRSSQSLLESAYKIEQAYQAFETATQALLLRIDDIATYQDYRQLRESLASEQEYHTAMIGQLQEMISSNNSMIRALTVVTERLNIIGSGLKSTMHLGAQIVDDYDQRGFYEHDLAEHLDQIQKSIHQSAELLLHCNEETQHLLESLPKTTQGVPV